MEKARTPRSLPLRDARDAKRLLARLANLVLRGDVPTKQATCIAYIVSVFLSSHESAELDELQSKAGPQ